VIGSDDAQITVAYTQAGSPAIPKNAGEYAVELKIGNPNYKWADVNPGNTGTYTIGKITVTVLPDNGQGKFHGARAPEGPLAYQASQSAYVSGETPVLSGNLVRDPGEVPGAYLIRLGTLALTSGDAVNRNYQLVLSAEPVYYTISSWTAAQAAAISPAAPDGQNGWYVTPVSLLPAAGLRICLSPSLNDADWVTGFTYTDGVYNDTINYYVRDWATGCISDQRTFARTFKQDQVAPTIGANLLPASGQAPESLRIYTDDNLNLGVLTVYNADTGEAVAKYDMTDQGKINSTYNFALDTPGSYYAIVKDAAGNKSGRTATVTAADADGDGLTDAWEQVLGTDPNVSDTDGDGLNDYAEVVTHHTNPLKPDSDGDGLNDSREISLKLNPNSPDTDGDGIDDQTFYNLGEYNHDDSAYPLGLRMLLGSAFIDVGEAPRPGIFADSSDAEQILRDLIDFKMVENAPNGKSAKDALKAVRNLKDETRLVLQFDANTGIGAGLVGDYLVRYEFKAGNFTITQALDLTPAGELTQGLERVVLLSDDGNAALIALWNPVTRKAEGGLSLAVLTAGRVVTIPSSRGASAFEISGDGNSVVFKVNNDITLYRLKEGQPLTLRKDDAVAFQFADGKLVAIGPDGTASQLDENNQWQQVSFDSYDTAQRTQTTRSRNYMLGGEMQSTSVDLRLEILNGQLCYASTGNESRPVVETARGY
jgi:hypothetical protein